MSSTEQQQQNENELKSVPTEKDLKDYSNKLESQLLESDQTIKIQKAMILPKNYIKFTKIQQDPIAKLNAPGSAIKPVNITKIVAQGDFNEQISKPQLKVSNKAPIKIISRDKI